VKGLLLIISALFVFHAQAQEETPPAYKPPITCFDIKAGATAYISLSEKFNEDHANPGSHGAMDYPQIQTKNYKGHSPYISIGGASRLSKVMELSYGLSYVNYVNEVSYQNKIQSKIPNTDYFLRTNHIANVKLTNHLYQLSFAPVFRIFNTKIEVGVLNLGYVNYSTKILSQRYIAEEVIYKHNSNLDSIVVAKEAQPTKPDLELKNRFHVSFSLGLEQEIPIKKYRYLVGVKGFVSSDVLVAVAYVGIRFSKPYTWRD
jgi:hypothetical protein